MSRNTTAGAARNVVVSNASYDINEDDDYVAVGTGWTGGTFTLPGPNSGHNAPNNGDQYTVADPRGLVTSSHTLTINGGGYDFLNNGALVASATFITLQTQGATEGVQPQSCCQRFTFDAFDKLWIVEV